MLLNNQQSYATRVYGSKVQIDPLTSEVKVVKVLTFQEHNPSAHYIFSLIFILYVPYIKEKEKYADLSTTEKEKIRGVRIEQSPKLRHYAKVGETKLRRLVSCVRYGLKEQSNV
jgi:hypothetical protein